jgi:energy-coupling factor transporter transmembrane protein EcfT
MVKLASVRETRMYGPRRIRDQCEDANAGLYLVATLLLLVGCVLLLPGYHLVTVGLYLVLVALILIVVVNLHDLYAQLAGFDFRLPLVTLDPQLALIEIAAPLVQALGGILYFIGTLLLLRVLSLLHMLSSSCQAHRSR